MKRCEMKETSKTCTSAPRISRGGEKVITRNYCDDEKWLIEMRHIKSSRSTVLSFEARAIKPSK